jgi:hypothetical protein
MSSEIPKPPRARKTAIDTLSRHFDKMLDRMQTAKARAAMKAAFRFSPKALGKAAVRVAKNPKAAAG